MNSQLMDECVEICQKCHATCAALIPHCLQLGGEHASQPHIGLLQDCAHICATALGFMLRESPRHALVCGACAEVSRQCAAECDRLADGDERMRECAEICARCAESCRRMVTSLRVGSLL